MARWTGSTPCVLALDGEDHTPHDYTHADQMFWCDGEGIENTPIAEATIDWMDEADWSKLDWDKVVAAENAVRDAKPFAVEEDELSLYDQIVSWCYQPATVFYSVLAIGIAFGTFLMAMAYLLTTRF